MRKNPGEESLGSKLLAFSLLSPWTGAMHSNVYAHGMWTLTSEIITDLHMSLQFGGGKSVSLLGAPLLFYQ